MVSRGYTGKYTLFTYENKKIPRLDVIVGLLVVAASISVVLLDAFVI
jgi:energy-coupling factor transporter transmembrane protein EcfT